jgi:hypothetical protein
VGLFHLKIHRVLLGRLEGAGVEHDGFQGLLVGLLVDVLEDLNPLPTSGIRDRESKDSTSP